MTASWRLCLSAAIALLAFTCSDEGDRRPAIDSGSHWLMPCQQSDDCGTDLDCICGLCTPGCDGAGACSVLADDAACVAPADLIGADCGDEATPPAGLCAADCGSAEECPEAPVAFDCVGGYCVADVPPPTSCPPSDCGPEPAQPNVTCSDGREAGPTGVCLRLLDGTCTWEIAVCEPPLCDDAECGPAPGMPNTLCADGTTMGGPTGRCLASAEGCGWEIIDCPPDDGGGGEPAGDCAPDECGPAMGMPNWLCDDGTIGGPACERDDDGSCGWIVVECADSGEPPSCTEADCGPAPGMPNVLCDDGVTVGGPACGADETGTCGWTIVDCPDETEPPSCDGAECGPAPGMPNYLCPDGVTVGGPVCQPAEDGDCSWVIVDCPE